MKKYIELLLDVRGWKHIPTVLNLLPINYTTSRFKKEYEDAIEYRDAGKTVNELKERLIVYLGFLKIDEPSITIDKDKAVKLKKMLGIVYNDFPGQLKDQIERTLEYIPNQEFSEKLKDGHDVFQLADEILLWLTTMTQEKRIEDDTTLPPHTIEWAKEDKIDTPNDELRLPLIKMLQVAWGTTDEKVAIDKTIEYLKHKFVSSEPIYIKKNRGDIVIS